MTKLQFVLWGSQKSSPAAFSRRVVESLIPRLMDHDPAKLKVTFTTREPPRFSVVPFGRRRLAVVSLWESDDQRGSVDWQSIMAAPGEVLAGYRVNESIPMAYKQDWPDGEQTPGVGLLTLFRRKPGLDDEDFLHRWHGVHSPLTMRNQPNWCYVRNVVEECLVEGSPDFDGIVEEHFRTAEDLLDPVAFFGGPWTPTRLRGGQLLHMVPNMIAMGLDVQRFIDLSTLETYLVDELHVKSGRREAEAV